MSVCVPVCLSERKSWVEGLWGGEGGGGGQIVQERLCDVGSSVT